MVFYFNKIVYIYIYIHINTNEANIKYSVKILGYFKNPEIFTFDRYLLMHLQLLDNL
jgi:hypothetical protein